jgi:DNA-binding response OmpR family regulator
MSERIQIEKKSVLIVEDDTDLAEVFKDALEMAGYNTLQASNVYEAYKKLENQKFHLIVVDMHLGPQNGEKVINVIRKDLRGLNIRSPILVCTGQLNLNSFHEIQNFVDDVLIKPVQAEDILKKAHYWTQKLSNKDHSKKSIIRQNKLKVLVAEDDIDLADNITTYLKSADFQVVTSYSYSDLRQKLTLQKFDCIILDRHINQQDSSHLAQQLRQDLTSLNNKTPVIMATADLTEDFIKSLCNEIQGFIYKPFSLSDIPKYINVLLDKEQEKRF